MRKILLLNLMLLSTLILNAQNTVDDKKETSKKENSNFLSKFSIKLGFNTVDANWGDNQAHGKNPLYNFLSYKEQAKSGIPLKLDLEYRFNEMLAFELSGSSNKWKKAEGIIDRKKLNKDYEYFAVDANFKFYFDDFINYYIGSDWLELYFVGGLGYSKLSAPNDGSMSVNTGFGSTVWVSKNFGINFSAVAKWTNRNKKTQNFKGGVSYPWSSGYAFNSSHRKYGFGNTTHTQYTLGISYRFGNHDKDNDGIYNRNDKCINIPGTKRLDGCPDKESLFKAKKKSN